MTTDDLELLQKIVERINSSTDGEFWDVISALRGPDMSNCNTLKYATTAVIRKKLGISENAGLSSYKDYPSAVQVRIKFSDNTIKNNSSDPSLSYHFLNHAQNAFNALCLKWDEVNDV